MPWGRAGTSPPPARPHTRLTPPVPTQQPAEQGRARAHTHALAHRAREAWSWSGLSPGGVRLGFPAQRRALGGGSLGRAAVPRNRPCHAWPGVTRPVGTDGSAPKGACWGLAAGAGVSPSRGPRIEHRGPLALGFREAAAPVPFPARRDRPLQKRSLFPKSRRAGVFRARPPSGPPERARLPQEVGEGRAGAARGRSGRPLTKAPCAQVAMGPGPAR